MNNVKRSKSIHKTKTETQAASRLSLSVVPAIQGECGSCITGGFTYKRKHQTTVQLCLHRILKTPQLIKRSLLMNKAPTGVKKQVEEGAFHHNKAECNRLLETVK